MSERPFTPRPYPSSLFERLLAALARRWLAFRYQVLDRRYGRLVLEELEGVPLLVLPEVFNPILLRTGAFWARILQEADGLAGLEVLDMGTGSGVGAIFAARQGARVTAVDINPEAVRCARINVLLNRLEERVEVLQGDLFAPLGERTFDLLLFNPPYYRGRPRDRLDQAWRGEGLFERFTAGLAAVLKPGGQTWLLLSSDGEGQLLLALLQEAGFEVKVLVEHSLLNELVTIYQINEGENR